MPEPITAERVCKVLEGMCLLDIDESDPKGFATAVYCFTHVARGTCKNPHQDWVELFLKTEKEVLDACDSPANKAKKEAMEKP